MKKTARDILIAGTVVFVVSLALFAREIPGKFINVPVMPLVDEDYSAGRHEVIWNGRDDSGRAVASGTYFYRIVAGSFKRTQKMVLMK